MSSCNTPFGRCDLGVNNCGRICEDHISRRIRQFAVHHNAITTITYRTDAFRCCHYGHIHRRCHCCHGRRRRFCCHRPSTIGWSWWALPGVLVIALVQRPHSLRLPSVYGFPLQETSCWDWIIRSMDRISRSSSSGGDFHMPGSSCTRSFPSDMRNRDGRPKPHSLSHDDSWELYMTPSDGTVGGDSSSSSSSSSSSDATKGDGETHPTNNRRNGGGEGFAHLSKHWKQRRKQQQQQQVTHRQQQEQQEQQQQQQHHHEQLNATKTRMELESMRQRITQLEDFVATQSVEITRLKTECEDLTHAAAAFARVIEMLRQAGLQMSDIAGDDDDDDDDHVQEWNKLVKKQKQEPGPVPAVPQKQKKSVTGQTKGKSSRSMSVVESFDDTLIFGTAPSSILEAADSAGAAILAGILGGQQRMLVDVRDADLSRDSETFVQFIELSILPVAAGLEGLQAKRNRLKIVFPTVSQLLDYRKTMALAAPEVVALSTLGFDPVEPQDNLVVIVAPAPNDDEGLIAMNELLAPSNATAAAVARRSIDQPIVVINHHMMPITGPAASFEVAYHLRLLTVQYMSGGNTTEFLPLFGTTTTTSSNMKSVSEDMGDDTTLKFPTGNDNDINNATVSNTTFDVDASTTDNYKTNLAIQQQRQHDAAFEAAMQHAHQHNTDTIHHGVTRAMVIRSYPKPWHVFVDTSPDTDADFEVAATFKDEPTIEDVHKAIVECLEGSEQEDELVAKQMQQALETGQLDRVSEMLGSLGLSIFDENDDDDDDDGDPYWLINGADTV